MTRDPPSPVSWRSLGALAILLGACTYDWPTPPGGFGASDAGALTPVVAADAGDAAPAAEAGIAPDAGSCAGALFCEPFERTTPPFPKWDDFTVGSGGTLRTQGAADARSSPDVLLAERPAAGAPPYTAFLRKGISAPLRRIAALSFDVFPERLDPSAKVCIAEVQSGNRVLRLLLGGPGVGLVRDRTSGDGTPHDLSRGLQERQWARVTLEIEATGRLRVKLGSDVVLDVASGSPWTFTAVTEIKLGIFFIEGPTSGVALRYDDVRFDGD